MAGSAMNGLRKHPYAFESPASVRIDRHVQAKPRHSVGAFQIASICRQPGVQLARLSRCYQFRWQAARK